MLIHLKMLLRELLLPPVSLLLLGLLGAGLLRRRPRAGRVLVVASLAALWCLSMPQVGFTLYRLTASYPALDPNEPVVADAIVILGGAAGTDSPEWGGLTMIDFGWDRVAYGAWLARRTGLPVLVTSSDPDSTAMRDTLHRAFGIDARWVDAAARDTFENARNTARLLQPAHLTHVVLVTHASHMQRAVAEFEAVGFRVIPAPVVVRPVATSGVLDWLPSSRGLAYSELGLYELIGRPVSALLRRVRS